jgi:hypothetical protein
VLSEQATKTRFEDTASYINPTSPAELLAIAKAQGFVRLFADLPRDTSP